MKENLIVYWSRRDFRLLDNPALSQAIKRSEDTGVPFMPLFILENYMIKGDGFGYPSRYFLAQAIPSFAKNFKSFVLTKGTVLEIFKKLSKYYKLEIFVNEDIHPDFYAQLEKMKGLGLEIHISEDALSTPKDTRTSTGKIYSVFTPFKNSIWKEFINKSEVAYKNANIDKATALTPESLKNIKGFLKTSFLEDTSTSKIWTTFSKKRIFKAGTHTIGLDDYTKAPSLSLWYTTEEESLALFKKFIKTGSLDRYQDDRNLLSSNSGTSKMSLALAWGLVSSRTLVKMIKTHYKENFTNPNTTGKHSGAVTYITELIWRKFYKYLLFHYPEILDQEFQKKFRNKIKWSNGTLALKRFLSWIKGETGFPIVDAAMMEIARTGYMHNRARMIVSSFLTKNLGIDWRWGQEYFRSALIDLDDASNNGGWQWSASVGADPKPMRIFNPDLQAQKYDKDNIYQSNWLTPKEYKNIKPIIDYKKSREDAIKRYKNL